MKKTTKGALAGGAAALLLLGGGGTLAYWNATADLGGGTITAGELGLTPGTTAWTLNGAPIADITAVRVVPGDVIAFSGDYTIVAVGDNLQAEVEVVDGTPTGDLAEHVTITPTYTLEGAALAPGTVITEANDGDSLDVALEIDFPFGTVVDNTSQTDVLNLSDIAVTLTQVEA